jgi:hypothetical protein
LCFAHAGMCIVQGYYFMPSLCRAPQCRHDLANETGNGVGRGGPLVTNVGENDVADRSSEAHILFVGRSK